MLKAVFNADERLNFPISKMILEGPEEKLKLTENTQPAILTVSFSIFKVLTEEFNFEKNFFKFFAGHSLGEYSALVSAQSINFTDALYLVHERGKEMQKAVPIGKGSMLAVLGMNIEKIQQLLKEKFINSGVCEVANDNAEGQIILSGDKENVEKLQKDLKEKKIKCIPLKVSAPFHCSLMKPAADAMEEKIKKIKFRLPEVRIISNVTSSPIDNSENIGKLLIEQIFSSVRWLESVINISKLGVSNFIEIGPGKVLSGMVKRTLKDVKSVSYTHLTLPTKRIV